jgi:hypothetical protein
VSVELVNTPRWKDVWAAFLWLANLLSILVVFFPFIEVINLDQPQYASWVPEGQNIDVNSRIGTPLYMSILLSVFLCLVYLTLLERYIRSTLYLLPEQLS